MRTLVAYLVAFGSMISGPGRAWSVTPGHVDTFEDGSTQSWSEGANSPNPPSNVPDGGPLGIGDNYLQNVSSGTEAAGGKWLLLNDGDEWSGNYLTAGVAQIRVDFMNAGADSLTMRLAFFGAATWYGTVQGFPIPPDGNWHRVTFELSQLAHLAGTATETQVMSRVNVLRIVAARELSYQGDAIAATAGVDNISALVQNMPTQPTTWGGLKGRFQ